MEHLHIFFLPMLAPGHIIPTLRMAELFASRNVKTTIISTAAFSQTIETSPNVNLIIIDFPPKESGLPDHVQTLEQVVLSLPKFLKALDLLQEPVEKLIKECKPSCIVSDMFFPWTTESAAKFGIPRLAFNGTSFFALCADEEMMRHKPFKNLSHDDDDSLVHVPNLPHRILLTRLQVPPEPIVDDDFSRFMERVRDSDKGSYGMVFNSFYELEPDYADHFQKVLGGKAWHIGPFFSKEIGLREQNGIESSTANAHECLAWLDSKRPKSVIYVCFGSLVSFTQVQLREIAIGLEASGENFIWVTRKSSTSVDENEDWLPDGFEKRMENRGLIIRGWAPQVVILDHSSIGAFVTHCGWNSILEGVYAGVPMVTWPLFAEQFLNEKLVTEVLKTGISVGNKKWQHPPCEGVLWDAVCVAVQQVMGGEAAIGLRSRAMYYKDVARSAIGEDGSSYNSLSALIQDMSVYNPPKGVKFD